MYCRIYLSNDVKAMYKLGEFTSVCWYWHTAMCPASVICKSYIVCIHKLFCVFHCTKSNIHEHRFFSNQVSHISCLQYSVFFHLCIVSLEYMLLCLPSLLCYWTCPLFLKSRPDFLYVLEANTTMSAWNFLGHTQSQNVDMGFDRKSTHRF